ncbi:hypothetical protein [Natronoglomus mannanivorans]|uniref:Uncharacterized protein n=1 Tax=Natronoglomus mannanivorans TaxID=2979990 RepID=A0AAP3E0V5_9EURY|nr:hypothetical protein [Halobacteria archaeon AArc-xg1-1]
MKRRQLLTSVTVGLTVPIGGCLSSDDRTGDPGGEDETGDRSTDRSRNRTSTETATAPVRPDSCPVTQDLGVSLPEETTVPAVVSFVLEYERAYVRDGIDEDEDEVTLTSEPSTERRDVADVGPGIAVLTSTVYGAIAEDGTSIFADPLESVPDDVDPLDVETLLAEADPAVDAAREAVDDETDVRWKDRNRDHEPIVASLESAQRGDRDYEHEYVVVVDETPVSVAVVPLGDEIDGGATAWYYVDDAVVRRADDREADPRDGRVVECLSPKEN